MKSSAAEAISILDLDSEIARQTKKAERRSRRRVPDPELYAMFAISQTVALDLGAKRKLGRILALHLELITSPEIISAQKPETMEAINGFAGWAIDDLKKHKKDFSDLPDAWQPALSSVINQYGNPDS
jgi:hypothetical protein